ncbi:TPA: acetoacetate decarboxylase family protein [Pseudomonas putida]|uniref:acetoacetate decarboxylase family protein n=1 Tax=Pseudomonas putida TaxID=303 RepID=UPI00110CCF94|nr:acetoacetate decarboxylase family protein [Pseudomonas putida]MCS4063796.1 acetoacetate decarboxylase [Pseudomonas putida]MDD1992687.1 acetoacetate decarboxylase family protein [Pseudomonas putida]HDS0919652.1 acetoacetate decarboxylase family protein [Pseudomonas putida]HDS0931752.1 acetoacetate decarboxylase family protein [Pseudomonas putida]HDS1782380.1 acetoacetate decarboxylase family protein [Pseudomonas putida]
MTKIKSAEAFMGPFSFDGKSSIAPSPPWHYAADFITVECTVDPETLEKLLPPGLTLNPQERGVVSVSFVDWQACTNGAEELLDPIRAQYRECIILASVLFEGTPMHYCPYIIVDQDTSLARGWALGYPKKIGSVWVTRTLGVSSIASPLLEAGSVFAGTVSVKDRRLADGHVKITGPADASAMTFGSKPIVALRHFPSMFEGEEDRPAVYELVRLRGENVTASPVWQGDGHLEIFDSATEVLSYLKPQRVGRGWRYSLAMTNKNNYLLRDLRNLDAAQ